ncbi:MAG: hypothetical protein Q9205_004413 [Flavoplaca limonia]
MHAVIAIADSLCKELLPAAANMPQDIADIRQGQYRVSLLDEMRTALRPQDGGEKRMPTLLLYDERGLQLFEDITYLDEYYLTSAEIDVLENCVATIVDSIPDNCLILELGSGSNLRKVKILLDALELAKKHVNYYALDLSKPELERTLSAVPVEYKYVKCHGLLGTYDDALGWLKRPELQQRHKWILTLGSSIGNFGRQEAANFLESFANTLGSNDRMVVGLDACQDKQKVFSAYNDRHGKTHDFVRNGLVHANRLLGKAVFKMEDWKVIGEFDEPAGRHQAFYTPIKDLVIDGVYIKAGEKIRVEESHKYSAVQGSELWQAAGLVEQASYGNSMDDYRLSATEPKYYQTIFERGIDPDVDNPALCHAHSEIPDTWPPVNDILDYQARVRARVEDLLSNRDGAVHRDNVGRALWLGFEHEAMHLETLLYMLLQSDKVVPPPGALPDFEALSQEAKRTAVGNEWIKIPASTVLVGMDDPASNNGSVGYFGWDNEKPARKKTVPAFEAKARPLTNEDFARYLIGTKQNTLPASWTQHSKFTRNGVKVTNGSLGDLDHLKDQAEQFDAAFLDGKFVRTVYGPIALRHALAWPVFASFDELTGCAQFMNGRIPTADEVRSIYNHVDLAKKEEAEKVQSKRISAVNGHLSNDGVEESPPSASAVNGSSSVSTHPTPNDLFIDLDGCNVGLSNFHPTAVTHLGNKLCGRGEMGGVWEWTSSALEGHEGFEAMDEYPGYTGTVARESADFFDGKHNIVLGGSWATHPRIAGRKSFVNCTVRRHRGLLKRHDPNMPQALLYKWEKNSGLDHKCGICKTVLSSPRAKKTCFGVHEEVCPKYHFTLFYIGNSTKCDASTELHDKRHREIASLILKIESLDNDEEATLSSVPTGKRKYRRRNTLELEYFQNSQALERSGEYDDWPDTSTLNDDNLEATKPGVIGMKDNHATGRMRKAERKQARSSSLLQVVTPGLMETIEAVLHPDAHPLDDFTDGLGPSLDVTLARNIIKENVGFNPSCFKPANMCQDIHAKRMLKSNGIGKIPSKIPTNEVAMNAILRNLDIKPGSKRSSKERVALLKQLRIAIRDDIDKVKNEDRDTMMRMAGYWRYVNRRTYNFMVRHKQIWDWATGQTLEEIEEEEETDLVMDIGDEALWDDASTIGTLRSGSGTPRKEVGDSTGEIQSGVNEQDTTLTTSMSRFHQSTPMLVESSAMDPTDSPERPYPPLIALEKDLRHHEISATIATHKFEERRPFVSPLPIVSTSRSSSGDQAFSPPHHDPNNRFNSLKRSKGGLNQPLGRLSSIKSLKLPSPGGRDPLLEKMNSWTAVTRKSSCAKRT